jgi:hypothetical protein
VDKPPTYLYLLFLLEIVMENYILIIEDKPEEQEFAKQTATSLGIETRVAGDFESSLQEIQTRKPKAIASDLFFPSGNINQEPYKQQVLPLYEAHLKTFKSITGGLIVLALESVFGGNKDTPKEKLWDEFIRPVFLKDWAEEGIESVKDAYFGIQFHSRYEKLEKQIQEIKNGRNIPYGIFVNEEARKLNIPCCIVTSTNHHDLAFEPIRGRIGKYTDRLDEAGHKGWKSAFEILKGGEENE